MQFMKRIQIKNYFILILAILILTSFIPKQKIVNSKCFNFYIHKLVILDSVGKPINDKIKFNIYTREGSYLFTKSSEVNNVIILADSFSNISFKYKDREFNFNYLMHICSPDDHFDPTLEHSIYIRINKKNKANENEVWIKIINFDFENNLISSLKQPGIILELRGNEYREAKLKRNYIHLKPNNH